VKVEAAVDGGTPSVLAHYRGCYTQNMKSPSDVGLSITLKLRGYFTETATL
jgi:hypothetical protein